MESQSLKQLKKYIDGLTLNLKSKGGSKIQQARNHPKLSQKQQKQQYFLQKFRLPKISSRQQQTLQHSQIININKELQNIKSLLKQESLEKSIDQRIMDKLNKMSEKQNKIQMPYQQPIFIPYPMPYPMQYPFQYPINMPPYQTNRKQPKTKKKTKKKTTKIPKKKIIHVFPKYCKLRKYVIAVFFALLLPKYAERFTRNKYKWFRNNYLQNNGQKIIVDSNKLRLKIKSEINVAKIINIDYQQRISNEKQQRQKVLNDKPKLEKRMQSILSDNFMMRVFTFITKYLQKLSHLILNKNIIPHYCEVLTVGIFNGSFLINYLLTKLELDKSSFHKQKGYLLANSKFEKVLLMNLLLVKIVAGNILFKDSKSNMLQFFIQTEQERQQAKYLLYVAASIIYIVCNQIFHEQIKQPMTKNSRIPQCKYHQLKKSYKVKPAQQINVSKSNEDIQNKHHDIIYGIEDYQKLKQLLDNNSNLLQAKIAIRDQIIDFIESLYGRLKIYHLNFYNRIKEQTIQEKYLLTSNIVNSQRFVHSEKSQSNYNDMESRNFSNKLNESILSENANSKLKESIVANNRNSSFNALQFEKNKKRITEKTSINYGRLSKLNDNLSKHIKLTQDDQENVLD